MKISDIKSKINLHQGWSGVRMDEKYVFQHLSTSIGLRRREDKYEISISSPDGYIKREKENLEECRKFLENQIDI